MQNDFEPAVSASSDLLCVLGDITFPPKNVVSCINPTTREIVWQKVVGSPAGVIVSGRNVFVSYYGGDGIEKYDEKGSLLWTQTLTGVLYTYLHDNQIQTSTIPEKYVALDVETGSQIEELKGKDIIYSTDTERFVRGLGIESWSLNMSQINWSVEIGNIYLRLKPLFTDNTVFCRTGQIMGSVHAVNLQTGQVLWQTDSNIIGNVVFLQQDNQVIMVTRDGKLAAVDVQSGKQTIWVEFLQSPFILNGETNEVVGGYELAYDENSKTLYLLLGDSRQLFAFRVN
jgi:outer membrane protein assembly factor BamB